MDMEFKTFKIRRDKECPVCGDAPTITAPIDYEQFCGRADPGPEELGGDGCRSSTREGAG
jgi:adenylyltransferase/sulfurtransferase